MAALITMLTPELFHEGLAREFVRRVQDLRKTSGFEIADRILISYQATPELAQAIQENGEYISSETLALELKETKLEKDRNFTDNFDGEDLILKLEKAVR